MSDEHLKSHKIHLAWSISLFALLITLFCARYAVPKFVHTPEKNMSVFLKIPYLSEADILPEPVEHARYIVALIVPTIILSLLFIFFQKSIASELTKLQGILIIGKKVEYFFGIILVFFIIYCLNIQNEIYSYSDNLHFYFVITFLLILHIYRSRGNLFRTQLFQTFKTTLTDEKKTFEVKNSRSLSFVIGLLIFYIGTLSFYPGKSPEGISVNILYTMDEFAAVINGLTPGVDFISQYSNYLPIIFSPLLRAIGLKTVSFTLLMAALNMFSLYCFYLILRSVAQRQATAFLLFLPVLGAYIYPIFEYPDGYRYFVGSYYGAFPLRLIMISWLAVGVLNFCKKQTIVSTLIAFTLSIVTAFNNLDFGIPALGAFLATWGCLQMHNWKNKDFVLRKVILTGILGLLIGICTYLIPVLLSSHGKFPNFENLTVFQRIFAKEGFYMLPLQSWYGLHTLIYITYMGSIILGLYGLLFNKKNSNDNSFQSIALTTPLLLFFGVLGLGIGMYYIGRTHWHTLVVMFPLWALTLGILFVHLHNSRYIRKLENTSDINSLTVVKISIISILIIFSFGLKYLPNVRTQITRLIYLEPRIVQNDKTLETLRSQLPAGTVTALFFDESHRLANDLEVTNIFPFGNPTIVLVKQLKFALDKIDEKNVKRIFTSTNYFNYFENEIRARNWVPEKLENDVVAWSRIEKK